MKKHVFLMQAHKEPELVERILHRLEAPNHYFIINIDQKVSREDLKKFGESFNKINNILSTRHFNVMHGGYSQIDCTINQLKDLYNRLPNFDYIHTISGQCYPCVSQADFDEYFEQGKKSYMQQDSYENLTKWKKDKYPRRLEHWYCWDVFNSKWMLKCHIPSMLNRVIYRINRPYEYYDTLWGGWNWFSLEHEACNYLMSQLKDHQEFVQRYKYTYCGDELIFSSILHWVSDQYDIEQQNSLRYVDWHPAREYKSLPLILNEKDYDSIIKSGVLFCRKVELEESAKLMDYLDMNALSK